MGVDISTYRCRIGCFSGIDGTAIFRISICCGFGYGLKTVMSMLLIGTLLIMAGIESNPGPIQRQSTVRVELTCNGDKGFEETGEKRRLQDISEEVKKHQCRRPDTKLNRQTETEVKSQFCSGKNGIPTLNAEVKSQFCSGKSGIPTLNAEVKSQVGSGKSGKPTLNAEVKYQFCLRKSGKPTLNAEVKNNQPCSEVGTLSLNADVVKRSKTDDSRTRRCRHYVVSVKCWPRVNKSQQVIKDLVEKCSYFQRKFELPEQQQKTIVEIDLYIDSDVDIDLTSLLVRTDKVEERSTVCIQVSTKECPFGLYRLSENFAGIYVDEEGVKFVEAVSPEQIDLIPIVPIPLETNESFGQQPQQCELHPIKDEISRLLELIVFEVLTENFNILKQIYERSMDEPSKDIADDSIDPKASKLEKHHKDSVEQLLLEIISFCKRSTLPKNKLPANLPGFDKKEVSKEMEQQLFGIDKTIRGCGYSHYTFNVNVERVSDEDVHKIRKERITSFLRGHGITKVKFNIVSKSITEYKRVGARIKVDNAKEEVYNQGTLGGFATFQKETDASSYSCALFSRHVTEGCSEKKLYVESEIGQRIELGEIIEETLEDKVDKDAGHDIAAAKIHHNHVSQCDVQFKNSEDEPRPGKLYTRRSIDLQDLPVHLWGSESKPGYGKITIPEMRCPGKTETFMQIEDCKPSQRLAVPGDSGAIVCADDLDDTHVHVISMLRGSDTEETKLNDPNIKITYIAFPVQEGVEYLQSKAGGKFSLKGVSNN